MRTQLMIRLSEKEKDNWKMAASQRGQTLSEFIRFVINMKIELETINKTSRESDASER